MSGPSLSKASRSFNTLSRKSVIASVKGKRLKVKCYQGPGCEIPSNKGKGPLGQELEGLGLSPWS